MTFSGPRGSDCSCSATFGMDSEAVTSIANSPWPHRAHASSSNSGASSTDGERCSTPGTLRSSKRKRSSFPNTKEVHPAWTYACTRLPHEPERNRHYQKLFYCKQCDYCQPIQNAEQHLRSSHGVRLKRITVSPILEALQRQKEKGESLVARSKRNYCSMFWTSVVFGMRWRGSSCERMSVIAS